MLWLVVENPYSSHGTKGFGGKHKRWNLETDPAPTLMADGIYGDCRSHYWLEDDGVTRPATKVEKPPYELPTMEEVRAVPSNGLAAVSTFSGCGGSCLGYRQAGYETVFASEFVPAARDTYRANFPDVPVDERDIREVKPEDILERIGKDVGEVDLMEGSPPCSTFSMAGRRERDWGRDKPYSDRHQRADDLFFEFCRLLKGVQPRAFSAENVAGLLRGTAKGYFKLILQELKDCGYRVEARLLDAQWLGVPQQRQRVFFVGVRNDLKKAPAFPDPLPYRYSVREALPWISSVTYDPHTTHPIWSTKAREFDVDNEPFQAVRGAQAAQSRQIEVTGPTPEELKDTDISRFAIGEEYDNVREGGGSERYLNLVRADRDRPSPTVTAAGGNGSAAAVVHPTEKRKFTIQELKAICSFPADFVLTGSYAQQWERLGRAVPPRMMESVATALRDRVLT